MSTPNTTTINGVDVTALAREYAEECIDPQGFSKSTYEELRQIGEHMPSTSDEQKDSSK